MGQHPLPQLGLNYPQLDSTRLNLNTYYTTYMEGIISQFIQKAVDHVDPHTQLAPAKAQDRASIDTN